VLYWRTTKGAEVDFVIETPGRVLPIEVKAGGGLRTSDARHLEAFLDEYADLAPAGLLLYDGDGSYWLTKRVLATPWWSVV
jgi:predicted AAA+ superfamily ATPase